MIDTIFDNALSQNITLTSFLISTLTSLALGLTIAIMYKKTNACSKSFTVTLAMLPAIVQLVIMMVNGNIGTGVAVMGAFSLVRFRSLPGNASEITNVFLAMAVGLATGMGFIFFAFIFVIIFIIVYLVYMQTSFLDNNQAGKKLVIVIPDDLYQQDIFNDVFNKYAAKVTLINMKTTNMGSLYKLRYNILIDSSYSEKEMIDQIRCRNGNLEVSIGFSNNKNEL